MTLREKQSKFVWMLGELIEEARRQGVELTIGEAYRTPEQAALNAQAGSGIAKSLHTLRLAVDLQLFIGGVYQTDSKAYEPLGVFWEGIGGSWGGRFKKRDGNHFSLAHGGIK